MLIGRSNTFAVGEPNLSDGGQVELVTEDRVVWSAPPKREEAGTPNVVGAIALAATIKQLEAISMDIVATDEAELTAYAIQQLQAIDDVILYGHTDPARPASASVLFNLAPKKQKALE